MTADEMKNYIISVLAPELRVTDGNKFSEELLSIKVELVLSEARTKRRYPEGYSEASILADMEPYLATFANVARYDYQKLGAEAMSNYTGDGTTMNYISRDKLWGTWIPISRVV